MEAFENSYKLFSLPYLFRDRDHYYQVMQGDIGRKILDSTKSKGYFGLTFYDGGARSFYGNKPVLKPDDLKGMKVRVQPSPGAVEMIKVMGGNPTPLDYGELYTALQQGVVDMAENSVMALTTMRHGEVAKSFSLDEHTMVPDVVLMSNAAFDKLSPENQAVILKAAKESMSYMKDLWSEEEKQEFAKLDKMGVKVYQVDKAPFIEKVQPMYANFAKDNQPLPQCWLIFRQLSNYLRRAAYCGPYRYLQVLATKAKRRPMVGVFIVPLNNELFSYYVYDHFREYFAVNLEAHFVFASGTQNAVRQTNFALSHFNASCSYSVSDVASTDGTEQFTFVASFRRDGNSFQCIDFLSASISSCQNFSQFSFQFSATCFEEFNVFLGSWNSFTLRYQEVTSIARFNVYLITQATQVCYFIKQNNLHYLILSKSY